jgi:hypothetical protein
MSHKVHQCVTVSCDDCGDDCWDEGPLHWPTLEAALEYLGDGPDEEVGGSGWTITSDLQICDRCTRVRACAAMGHPMGDWITVKDGLGAVRWCGCGRELEHGVRVVEP